MTILIYIVQLSWFPSTFSSENYFGCNWLYSMHLFQMNNRTHNLKESIKLMEYYVVTTKTSQDECWQDVLNQKNHLLQVYPNLIHMTIGKTLSKHQHDKDDGKRIDRVRIMGENGMGDGGNSNDR